ncbi:MAG TPA: 50S ribosomal protein L17 [bacterium]|nr:50S ribosomal protein L17 [bacterium]
MRHRAKTSKLGRTGDQRAALMRAQATSLMQRGRLVTTTAKAKVLRGYAERLVSRARVDNPSTRREAAKKLYTPEAVTKLFTVIAPKFKDRPGGYLRLVKLGQRKGDGAPLTLVEFVEQI